MKIARQITIIVVLTVLVVPLFAAEDDAKALGQFQEILEGVDQKSFEMFKRALDQTDLTNRIYSHQQITDGVREIFRGQFWQIIESGFLQGLPPVGSAVKAELVQFEFQDGRGQACVRFNLPRYEYTFQVFELRHDSRGRIKIVDWFDSSNGQSFSAHIGEELITVMPTKASTRELLTVNDPTELQLFQVTEILKATRDGQPPRFFEIYDEFDEQLRREPLIAKHATLMAYLLKDMDRFARTLDIFVEVYSEDPNLALMTSDFYVVMEDYESSYVQLQRYYQYFNVKEGALPAKLSALALAIGKPDDAEEFAVAATVNEPELELGWWSLLRARAAARNFAGALEALTYLEDNFDHRLDEAKLRRDKYRAFASLASSQEFKDWRAGRK
jgi:hypothetical protein